jgi:hypothetical protein
MLKRIIPVITLLFAIPVMMMAQVTTSSLSGNVTGANNEPLVGATVTATHQPSGTKYVTISKSGGQFNIANMRVGGPYLVEISFVGFQTDKQDEVYLKLAETFLLNSSLKSTAGELAQVVLTSGRRNPILNAQRTGAVTNIGSRELQRLPSITRNINDFTRVTPQANGNQIGGGNYRQNNFTIDGADFNNSFGIGSNLPANGAPISIDALEEISVNITPYDVRQSGFIGSAINAVTRAGTNTFTGSAYTYWRTEKQRGDKVDKTTFTRPAEKFNQYGIRIGGPIIKNKVFFFFNYETEKQPKAIQTRFAATSGAPFGSSPQIAKPTVTEMDMIRQYLATEYGYETGAYDNYTPVIDRIKIMGRLDWNINSKNRMNIRYSQVEGGEPNPVSTSRSPFTGYAIGTSGRTDNNALWYKNTNYYQGANFYSLAAELNSQLGGRISNTFRATYTYQNDSRQSDSQIFPFVDILDGTTPATSANVGIPFASFGYEPFTFGNLRKVKMWSVVDNLTWTSGKHNWTVGGQYDESETINGFQRFGTSYYTFASWSDFVNGAKPKDFGITYSLAPGFTQAFPSFKFAQFSLYGQDEISVNKTFKLTLGLRLDLPTYPDVSEIVTHPLVDSVRFAKGENINTGNLPKKRIMWSPRIGFNWDLYGDRSFQIRGGTGIFTGKVPFVWIVSQSGDAGMLQVTSTSVGQANTPGPFDPDPVAYRPATVPKAGTVVPSTISAMAKDFKLPQTWKTSIAFDTRLARGLILTVEAIYNKDVNTAVFRNPNLVDPQPLNVAGYPDNRMIYPNPNNQKFVVPLTSATFNATTNPLPSYPVANGAANGTQAFNAIVLDNGSKGHYFSLTAKIDKQFSNGLFASIAYTKSFANNLFDGGGDQPLSAWQGTANVNGANFPVLGYAGFVVPDRVLAAFSYRKEYFKHLGTTLSVVYEGGIQGRFSYTYSADLNRDGTNFDLIYIPKDPSEITFVDKTVNGVLYNAAAQSELFFKYIEQDKYLKKHKGQYAERNGGQYPWRNEVSLKFLQDLFVGIGKNRNTLQFSVDIFNLGNLINPSWGRVKVDNARNILVPQNQAALVPGGTVKPTFQLATDRTQLVSTTFRDVVSTASTYSMQFGLRYLFNN